jgi:O-antigen ligase
MVMERPVFGQGPGMVEGCTRASSGPRPRITRQPHLHNNVLQIAAERGLPGLVFFLWWVGVAFLAALREARPGGGRAARTALGRGGRPRRSARSSWPGSSNTISATPRC